MEIKILFTPYYYVESAFKEYESITAPLTLNLLNSAAKYFLNEVDHFLAGFLPLETEISGYPYYRTLSEALEIYKNDPTKPSGRSADFDNDASFLIGVIPKAINDFVIHGPSAANNNEVINSLIAQVKLTHSSERAIISSLFYYAVIIELLAKRRLNYNKELNKTQIDQALNQAILSTASKLRTYKHKNSVRYFVKISPTLYRKDNVQLPSESLRKISPNELKKSAYVIDVLEASLSALAKTSNIQEFINFIISLPGASNMAVGPALALGALAYSPMPEVNEQLFTDAHFDFAIDGAGNKYISELFPKIINAFTHKKEEEGEQLIGLLYAEFNRLGYYTATFTAFFENIKSFISPVVKKALEPQLN